MIALFEKFLDFIKPHIKLTPLLAMFCLVFMGVAVVNWYYLEAVKGMLDEHRKEEEWRRKAGATYSEDLCREMKDLLVRIESISMTFRDSLYDAHGDSLEALSLRLGTTHGDGHFLGTASEDYQRLLRNHKYVCSWIESWRKQSGSTSR